MSEQASESTPSERSPPALWAILSRIQAFLAPSLPVSQDGLPGSLTVGFWVGLANGRQWQEIGGWEIRESRLSDAFLYGIISRGGASPRWSSTSSRQCPWADLQLLLRLLGSQHPHSAPASLPFIPPAPATCFASLCIAPLPLACTASISKESPLRTHVRSAVHRTSSSSLSLEGSCRARRFPSSTRQPCRCAGSQGTPPGLHTAERGTRTLTRGLGRPGRGVRGPGRRVWGPGRQAEQELVHSAAPFRVSGT